MHSSALDAFRKRAKESKRLAPEIIDEPDSTLLEKLHLREGRYLKRAAVLLFHPDPEAFVTGAFVKIGFFRSPSDLLYHDEVKGTLFSQVDACLELLQTKYLKAAIHYRGVQRIERFPVPEAALREVLLNALVHRDYAVAAPVQIRGYEDRLSLWNPAVLPQGWTLEKLCGDHPSVPFNPDIANTFFRAGEIEAWGRGIPRIFEACRDAGTPEPRLSFETGEFLVEFPFSPQYLELLGVVSRRGAKTQVETQVETRVKTRVKTPEAILMLLRKNPTMTLAEVAKNLGKSTSAVERAAAKLRQQGRLCYEGPKKSGRWKVQK